VCLACRPRANPQAAYDHARAIFVHGDLVACQKEARQQYERLRGHDDEWAWKFKILEAEALLWQGGRYLQVVQELGVVPTHLDDRDAAIRLLAVEGFAQERLGEHSKAAAELDEADQLCAQSATSACGGLMLDRGAAAVHRSDLPAAARYFRQGLAFARTHGDPFLEASSLLNVGEVYSLEERLDEAVDWSNAAYRASKKIDALDLAQTALGNLGVAYYNLGDSEQALEDFLSAKKDAAELGDKIGEMIWLRHTARIYVDRNDTEQAAKSLRDALGLARESGDRNEVYRNLEGMSWLGLQTGNLDEAAKYAEEALQNAQDRHDRGDELDSILVRGQIAARRGNIAQAQQAFESVQGDKACSPSLRWGAQHLLARVFEDQRRLAEADRTYRDAISTFEGARDTVMHEELRLPFLKNGEGIYDDYVHFLVAQGKKEEALRWADYSRARTLLEGLGLLSKVRIRADKTQFEPPRLNAQAIAARIKGAVLYYWLGETRSYLWAITPKQTKLFTLPLRPEIEAEVERYRKALTGPVDVLGSNNEDGQLLYRTLVLPAQPLLPKGGRVIVIPDGNLNNLNFETLIASDPAPHYWIEDVVIANASSLRVLAASYNGTPKRKRRKMLLIGNSVAPNEQYPALPNAQAQMDSVARHFRDPDRQIIAGKQATPASFLASHPEQFSHIHFVAHGTASRLSPLDSAIILSRDPAESDSFKLYARDIIHHPLQADLVTISACYGAGERSYSGEGLVGLAWAFLRAGSHNVIAGLWEVTDASTERLMDRFYDELDKGSTPDAALRAAKLSLLHGGTFRNPYYWAPFQLYSGS